MKPLTIEQIEAVINILDFDCCKAEDVLKALTPDKITLYEYSFKGMPSQGHVWSIAPSLILINGCHVIRTDSEPRVAV